MKIAAAVLSAFLAAFTFQTSGALAGPKVEFGEGGSLSLGLLGQVQGTWVDSDAVKDDFDIFLRRGRLILSGQITDGIKVFAETDYANAGRTGSTATFVMQDIFADVRIVGDHAVEVGLILLPFSFESGSSAASLLGLDYNSEVIKLTNSHVWRDLGAMAHGNVGGLVSYRVGVFDGYDQASKNEEAALRFAGHIAVNPIGKAEAGWFYNQVRLDQPTYVSLGAGFDTQGDATAVKAGDTTTIEDATAWVIDLQSAGPVGPLYAILNGAYYDWDSSAFKGKTAFAEAGALYGKAMATFKWTLQDPDKGDSVNDYTVGLHYFLKGQTLRGGLEYRTGDSPDAVLAGVQFLL